MVFTTLVNEITMKGIALLLDMQVRRSMCRIKQVLTERALAEEDASRRKALRNMINGMWEKRKVRETQGSWRNFQEDMGRKIRRNKE